MTAHFGARLRTVEVHLGGVAHPGGLKAHHGGLKKTHLEGVNTHLGHLGVKKAHPKGWKIALEPFRVFLKLETHSGARMLTLYVGRPTLKCEVK
jgi:hypothetical protein